MGYMTVISMHSTTNLFHCQTREREKDDQYSGSQLILLAEKDIYTVLCRVYTNWSCREEQQAYTACLVGGSTPFGSLKSTEQHSIECRSFGDKLDLVGKRRESDKSVSRR